MTATKALHHVQGVFWQRAEALMLAHTNPWELDEALTNWGFEIGPCEAQDLLGLEKVLARAPKPHLPILSRMVAEGRIGKAGSVGFYRYPGGGGAVIDPLIEDLILEEARFAKVERSALSDAKIVVQMIACLRGLVEKEPDVIVLLERAVHFPMDRIEVLTS